MHAAPDPRVHDLRPEVGRCCKRLRRVQVAGRAGRIEAVDREVDLLRVQEGAEHLRHHRAHDAVRRRVLGMVRRRDERPPPGLLGRGRIPISRVGTDSEEISARLDGRRIDRRHRPPEPVVVLGVHRGNAAVRRDDVDHRH